MKKYIYSTLIAVILMSSNFAFAYNLESNKLTVNKLNAIERLNAISKLKTEKVAQNTPEYCKAKAEFDCWKYVSGTKEYNQCKIDVYNKCMGYNKS